MEEQVLTLPAHLSPASLLVESRIDNAEVLSECQRPWRKSFRSLSVEKASVRRVVIIRPQIQEETIKICQMREDIVMIVTC